MRRIAVLQQYDRAFRKVSMALSVCKDPSRWGGRQFVFTLLLFLILLSPIQGWAEERPAGESNIKTLYQEGRYVEIIQAYEGKTAGVQEALYLGLSYLRTGNLSLAIPAWKQYIQINSGSEGTREISQYLTLLMREEAKRTAREMLQQEQNFAVNSDPRAIAVFPFQNLGQPTYAPLSKGLAAMMITDLSQVKTLKVVERVQIHALLDELKLAQSGLVDPQSAPRVGKLLGAGKITLGSFLDFDPEKIHLNAATAQSERSELLANSEAEGDLSVFYKLQKELVFKILCGMGYCPESLDASTQAAVETIHTRNLKAFMRYAQGLDYLDQGQYPEAARAFFQALQEDPEFELARRALLETPLFPLDLPAIISAAEEIDDNLSAPSVGGTPFTPFSILEKPADPQQERDSVVQKIEAPFVDPGTRIFVPPEALPGIPVSPTTPVQIEIKFRPLSPNDAASAPLDVQHTGGG